VLKRLISMYFGRQVLIVRPAREAASYTQWQQLADEAVCFDQS
jgi:hypothetical protein